MYANSDWNDQTGEFVIRPSISVVTRIALSDDAIESAFYISWVALIPLARGKFAVMPYFSEGVQLGIVTLRYPCMLIQGRGVCNPFRYVLQQYPLNEVL